MNNDKPIFSAHDIMDAYERLDWSLHDVAMLLATLEEMLEERQ